MAAAMVMLAALAPQSATSLACTRKTSDFSRSKYISGGYSGVWGGRMARRAGHVSSLGSKRLSLFSHTHPRRDTVQLRAEDPTNREIKGNDQPVRHQIRYGSHPDQYGDLYIPQKEFDIENKPVPLVVLIHGGFWQHEYSKKLEQEVANEIAQTRLAAVWNIEYRRVGKAGLHKGWPEIFLDVSAAMDRIADMCVSYSIDPNRIAVVGHSAGGHLAMWTAMRRNIPQGSPGANPKVMPQLVISQSGVTDLTYAYNNFVGGYAIPALLGSFGGGRVDPQILSIADPAELLPSEAKLVSLHAERDKAVPIEISKRFTSKAKAKGCNAHFLQIQNEDHMAFVNTRSMAHHCTMMTLQEFFYPDLQKEIDAIKAQQGVSEMRRFTKETNTVKDKEAMDTVQRMFRERDGDIH
ncbi:hypothetical protein AAMO2058_000473500 [Amorphochlora amoebiformis]